MTNPITGIADKMRSTGASTKDILLGLTLGQIRADIPDAPPLSPDLQKPAKYWIITDSQLAQARSQLLSAPNLSRTLSAITSGISKIQAIKPKDARESEENKQAATLFLDRLQKPQAEIAQITQNHHKYLTQHAHVVIELQQIFNTLKQTLREDATPATPRAIIDEIKKVRLQAKTLESAIETHQAKLVTIKKQLDTLHTDIYLKLPTAERGTILPPEILGEGKTPTLGG